MNPHVRPLAAALALAVVAVAYFMYQGRIEQAGPPRPAPALPATRPAPLPPAPPTAREILDQRAILDLRGDQIVRLEALDRLWVREVRGLEAMVHDAGREFSIFATEAQEKKRASLQEIQRRSAEYRELSAELRARRQQHSDAALRVLDERQRQRVVRSRGPANEGRNHEARRN